MHEALLRSLSCPACGSAFDADVAREHAGDLLEAFLVCRSCREVRLVAGGVGVLPSDLPAHFRRYGHVYRRMPLADPRVVRFVLSSARKGTDFVPFDEVLARYGDLAPGRGPGLAPQDAPLARLLEEVAPPRGLGLEVGCGVGRSTFLLAERLGEAVGLDRSLARVRRARNLAATREEFRVPAGPGRDEVPLDLARLSRDAADFLAADAWALPLRTGVAAFALLRAGDGEGAWPSPGAAVAEARRVLAPGGTLVLEEPLGPPAGAREAARSEGLVAWR